MAALAAAVSTLTLLAPTPARADHPSAVFGTGLGGPAWTPVADTLPQGRWAAVLFSEYRRFDQPSAQGLQAQAVAAGDHAHSLRSLWAPSLALAYGLTDRVTLAVRLPYLRRSGLEEAHVHANGDAGFHRLGTSAGTGDLSVGGQWRFWDNGRGSAAALSFGSFLPTGVTSRRSLEGERFEADHQPGAGAWRPFLGAVFSHTRERVGVHTYVRVTRPFEGTQSTRLGERLDYGVALAYALNGAGAGLVRPHQHAAGEPAHDHHHDEAPSGLRWSALLELNGEYVRPERVAGLIDGRREHALFLSPGIRVSGFGNWSAALSIGRPVLQRVGPEHVGTDWRVLASIGAAF